MLNFNLKATGIEEMINKVSDHQKQVNLSGRRAVRQMAELFKSNIIEEMTKPKTGNYKAYSRGGSLRRSRPNNEGLATDTGHTLEDLLKITHGINSSKVYIDDNSNDSENRGNYFRYWEAEADIKSKRPTFENAMEKTQSGILPILTKNFL
jgi:hypothetical protein